METLVEYKPSELSQQVHYTFVVVQYFSCVVIFGSSLGK